MSGQKNLDILLDTMNPELQSGQYVFCTLRTLTAVNLDDILMCFKEQEGYTIVLKKELADAQNLSYSFITSWITLTVHSSLEAVGLTAAFSTALANEGISCNVVAAFYHDHIFVNLMDTERALNVLRQFKSKTSGS